MASALTLIVFVAAGEGAEATTGALARATREALGPGALVIVREAKGGDPSDVEALAAEHTETPDAVAELTWTQSHHRQATLRLHLARAGRWVGRVIGFHPTDAEAERGRTLGFAIASIVPMAAETAAPVSSSAPPPSSPPAPTPSVGSAPATPPPTVPSSSGSSGDVLPAPPPHDDTPTASPGVPPPASSATAPPVPPAPPPPAPGPAPTPLPSQPPRSAEPQPTPHDTVSPHTQTPQSLAAELLGTYSGTTGRGFGGALAFEGFPVSAFPSWALRVALSYGSGDLPDGFQGSIGAVSAGVAFHPVRASLSFRFGFSARVDWLLAYNSVSGPGLVQSQPSPPVRSGGDAVAGASLLLTPDIEVVARGGLQWLPPVNLTLTNGTMATENGLALCAESGIVIRF